MRYRCEITITVVCKVHHFTYICSSLQVLTGVKSGNDSVASWPVSSAPPRWTSAASISEAELQQWTHDIGIKKYASTWERGGRQVFFFFFFFCAVYEVNVDHKHWIIEVHPSCGQLGSGSCTAKAQVSTRSSSRNKLYHKKSRPPLQTDNKAPASSPRTRHHSHFKITSKELFKQDQVTAPS